MSGLVPKVVGISGGLHHAQPAAGAGAHEDHAAAFADALDDNVHAQRDARLLALHGGQHLAVVVQHELDDVGRGQLVDAERGGVDGFGR